ncbi:HxlR family transcriptional regulator [Azospirillum thiophilum]|uniref:HxlR family transcriptional regulator n=1 Tax=Azospirillum thiophilum TaxID=528244 RepID=A0AAC8VWZ7_9PROT|nr:helix-turn-helix domain-containing protein [Azospirillum thiophilum]ALG71014.1 HxlR family transcriptional regulator [Azospirillum thiophilum]KJR65323.1 HxlR family transcriptional regulator [Azospirillum thiophilum]
MDGTLLGLGGKKPSEAVQDPNAYISACPTRQALDRIADKWTVLILGLLEGGPMRFNRLRREIEGISQKMLSQTLKSLERDGLVSRKVFATVPVTVEYSITPLGATLAQTLVPLRIWAETHIARMLEARAAYDRVEGDSPARLDAA